MSNTELRRQLAEALDLLGAGPGEGRRRIQKLFAQVRDDRQAQDLAAQEARHELEAASRENAARLPGLRRDDGFRIGQLEQQVRNLEAALNQKAEEAQRCAAQLAQLGSVPVTPADALLADDGGSPTPAVLQALDEAEVSFAVDVKSSERALVFGMKAWGSQRRTRPLRVLRIGVDMATDDVERLLAVIRLTKGRDDCSGGWGG
jgi:hypothetical protein